MEEINNEKLPTYMRWLALAMLLQWLFLAHGHYLVGWIIKTYLWNSINCSAGNDAKLSEIALAIEDALSNHEETKRAIPDIV